MRGGGANGASGGGDRFRPRSQFPYLTYKATSVFRLFSALLCHPQHLLLAPMTCLACRRWGEGVLCGKCRVALVAAPDRYLAGGMVVRAAFLHTGPARALVHRLKYEGIRPAAECSPRLWSNGGDLFLIHWCRSRGLRCGCGGSGWTRRWSWPERWRRSAVQEVRAILRAPLWASQRAGRRGSDRRPPRFATLGPRFRVSWSTMCSPPARRCAPRRRRSTPVPARPGGDGGATAPAAGARE